MKFNSTRILLYIVTALSASVLALLMILFIKMNFTRPNDVIVVPSYQSISSDNTSSIDSDDTNEHIQDSMNVDDPSGESEDDDSDNVIIDVYSDDSVIRIVNPDITIRQDYIPEGLVASDCSESGEILLREDAAIALREMFDAAATDGIYLNLLSGYRDYALQEQLYAYYVERFGEEYASYLDCRPGMSEHQTGLAVDLGTADHENDFNTDFQYTDEYEWLTEHSYEYGYILRYPADKREITHVMFSPWNFRYIGKEEAEKVFKSNLSMEEFYLNN